MIFERLLSAAVEGFLMSGVGLGVLGIRLKIVKLIAIAFLYSSFVYGIRETYMLLGIKLGTHLFFVMIFMVVLFKYIGKQSILDGVLATLINIAVVLFGETVFLIPFLTYLGIDVNKLFALPHAFLIGTVIYLLPLILLFVVVYIKKITLININILAENI